MVLISHRGNLHGPKSCVENHPDSIHTAIRMGFDCEIDTWYIDGKYFLGHDAPEYEVNLHFFLKKGLWVHCKNLQALTHLKTICNAFFHDKDDCTLTSKGFIWVYPEKETTPECVLVKLTPGFEGLNVYGVCSDYVSLPYSPENH